MKNQLSFHHSRFILWVLLLASCATLYAGFPGSASAGEAGIAPVITPATEIGPPPGAVTATVVAPQPPARKKPEAAADRTVAPEKPRGRSSSLGNYWKKLDARFGVGLSASYLLSLGPGNRYISSPTFMLEGLARIPLNATLLIPAKKTSVTVGIASGFYDSSVSQDWNDEIRGDYQVSWYIRVIPLYLNIYYDIPFTSNFSVSLGAGVGATFASLNGIHYVSLNPEYSDPRFFPSYGDLSSTSFSYQFIGKVRYQILKIGEAFVEIRQNQARFSASGHPESKGDLGGLCLGAGYSYLF